MVMVMKAGKFVFGFSLFVAFIGIFGLKSLERYLERAVIVHTRQESSKGLLEAPGVTICLDPVIMTRKVINMMRRDSYIEDSLKEICKVNTNKDDDMQFKHCFETQFLNTSEMIREVVWNKTRVQDPNMWMETITNFYFGKCQALQYEGMLGTGLDTNSVQIILNPNHDYYFFLHDPNFFFLSSNPITIPRLKNRVALDGKSMVLKMKHLAAAEHRRLNREGSPCNKDVNYKFSDCI